MKLNVYIYTPLTKDFSAMIEFAEAFTLMSKRENTKNLVKLLTLKLYTK